MKDTKILEGTIFQRTLGNGSAFVLGVVRTEQNPRVNEGVLYAIDIADSVLMGSAWHEVTGEHGDYFSMCTIDSHLRNAMWPGIKRTDETASPTQFFAVVIPLRPISNWHFFYAALKSPILQSTNATGDDWYELQSTISEPRSQWSPRSPLVQTRGQNATTLMNCCLWPVGADRYNIRSNPTNLTLLQSFFRSLYVKRHRSGKPIDNAFRGFAINAAEQQGFDPELINSIAFSAHSSYLDREFLSVLDQVEHLQPDATIRAIPSSTYCERENAFKVAIAKTSAFS